MDETAQHSATPHWTGGFVRHLWNGELLIATVMRTRGVEERRVFAHHTA